MRGIENRLTAQEILYSSALLLGNTSIVRLKSNSLSIGLGVDENAKSKQMHAKRNGINIGNYMSTFQAYMTFMYIGLFNETLNVRRNK